MVIIFTKLQNPNIIIFITNCNCKLPDIFDGCNLDDKILLWHHFQILQYNFHLFSRCLPT
jgi:hypothetical protein